MNTSQDFTPFELEVLDYVLWLLRGYRERAITQRVATRMLRAGLRRIKPPLIGVSVGAEKSDDIELDHAVPISIIAAQILARPALGKDDLIRIISTMLGYVTLTRHEHRVILDKAGLSKLMPAG